jgi:hypothetical protein
MDSSTFEELKKLCISNKATNIEMINTIQKPIEDGYIGIIENKFNDDQKYEIYLYIQWKKAILSPLLLKAFTDVNLAKEYYSELLKIIGTNSLIDIINSIKNYS